MTLKLLGLAAALASISAPSAAWAQCGHGSHESHNAPVEDHHHQSETPPAGAKTVRVLVTADGFSPSEIRIRAGERIVLDVTRTTDGTCAKEIVIPEYAVRKMLPLDEPISIELTPAKAGTVRFACGMDMISGMLVIE